jgi:molybdopterin-guanine dinucleotide biosynthesis protein B
MGTSQKRPISRKEPPMICVVGRSGSGKTTLMEKLINEMKGRGIKVGTIKHHKGPFSMDSPGKDSWRHKQAGSVTALISSPSGIGMVADVDHDHSLDELVLYFSGVDVILCEGYKRAKKPKIEVFRPEVHERPFCLEDRYLKALVSDVDLDLGVPRFPLSDIKGLAEFLCNHFGLARAKGRSLK